MAKLKKSDVENVENNISQIKKNEHDDNEHTLDKHNPLDKYDYKTEIGSIVNSCKYRQQYVDEGLILCVNHLKQFFFAGSGKNRSKLKAVHNVSFSVKRGEVFGLVGESGCGKTVIARDLIHFYNITSGSIYYKGYRIGCGSRWNEKEIKWTKVRYKERLKELKAQYSKKEISKETYKLEVKKAQDFKNQVVNIQKQKIKQIKYDNNHVDYRLLNEIHLAFEDTKKTIEPNRSIHDVLVSGFEMHRSKIDETKIAWALNLVGIKQTELDHKVIDLDDYKFNCLEIARALVHGTKLLVCDEMHNSKDQEVIDKTITLLKKVKKECGLTIIFITSNIKFAKEICDRVAVIKSGEIVEIVDNKSNGNVKKAKNKK